MFHILVKHLADVNQLGNAGKIVETVKAPLPVTDCDIDLNKHVINNISKFRLIFA
ncbi:hypothetical protein ACFS5N_05035 [Mucilaginibacter ximonensis]|uniref:Uncharacterized protein n=1 Tax=Mucilaginibacter ximonensis TaxID=538021 RepID=A0ABW5YA15_9SPHI